MDEQPVCGECGQPLQSWAQSHSVEDCERYRRRRKVERDYGFTPREDQSTAILGNVPAAVIQEARDSCAPGDARSLLTRVLIHAGVEEAKSDG